jgi:hypothetical protein
MSEKKIKVENIKEFHILGESIEWEIDGKTIAEVVAFFGQFPLDAKFTIEAYEEYGAAYLSAKIFNERLETDGEFNQRVALDNAADQRRQDRRRAEFEKLKKEFEE